VFSRCDQELGLTKAVCHEISLEAGAGPIWQPTLRLGPEKEKEVSHQEQNFMSRDLIELAHSAWSSPVVLVWKNDGSCTG